jgi:hypothetical protein
LTSRHTILCLLALLTGCGGDSQTASIGWSGDKIRLQIGNGGSGLFSKPTVTCVSCQTAIPPFPVTTDDNGVVEFNFPDAKEQIVTRFYIEANGIDTAVILQPPSPEIATRQYSLTPPLAGRVMVTQLAIIYRDTMMDATVGTLEREDEANIFGEDTRYYFVHHPLYREPVVVLKSHAIRIQ